MLNIWNSIWKKGPFLLHWVLGTQKLIYLLLLRTSLVFYVKIHEPDISCAHSLK